MPIYVQKHKKNIEMSNVQHVQRKFNAIYAKRVAMIVGIILLIGSVRTHAALNVTTEKTITDVSEVVGWPADETTHTLRKPNRVIARAADRTLHDRGKQDVNYDERWDMNSIMAMVAYGGVIVAGSVGLLFVMWSRRMSFRRLTTDLVQRVSFGMKSAST